MEEEPERRLPVEILGRLRRMRLERFDGGQPVQTHDARPFDGGDPKRLAGGNPPVPDTDAHGLGGQQLERVGGTRTIRLDVRIVAATHVDLETGRPVEAPNNEKRPQLNKWARDVCPNLIGGKNWSPMSYSPQTGLVYLPAFNMCMDIANREEEYSPGKFYLASEFDLAKARIGPRGPLTLAVANENAFAVSGTLSGRLAGKRRLALRRSLSSAD